MRGYNREIVRRFMFPAVVVVVAGAFALGYAVRQRAEEPPAVVDPATQAVRQLLAERYVTPLDANVLASATTIPQLLDPLHRADPFTTYLTPQEYAAEQADSGNRYYGVGIRVVLAKRLLVVSAVLPGTPAARARLRRGDLIRAIDGVPTRGAGFDAALSALQSHGTRPLRLLVKSKGRSARTVKMKRSRIELASVSVRTLRHGRVRIVRISQFAQGTSLAVSHAAKDAKRVILDLRGNPGGLFGEAIATVDLFLHRGRIVSWSGAHATAGVRNASGHSLPRMPLVVLVDGETASSAEIVASALQENGRALVVGVPTFGKSSIQAIEPLPNSGALKLTVAHYRTARERDLGGRGVIPDRRGGLRVAVELVSSH